MATIAALIFSLAISLGFPIGALIYYIVKQKNCVLPYLFGVVTFLVFQYLTRVPLLQALSSQNWFVAFAQKHIVLYSVFLGLTAGLFEEGGRFIVMKLFMKKHLTWQAGVAHGIGHGGFEAATLLGVNYIATLLIAPQALLIASPGLIVLAGLERAMAMIFHVGASVLVLRGIRLKRYRNLFIAILLHTLLDAPLGVFVNAKVPTVFIELYVALFAIGMLVYIFGAAAKERKENQLQQEVEPV